MKQRLTSEPILSTIASCPQIIHAKMRSLETSIVILEYVGIVMDSINSLLSSLPGFLNQLINRALETDRWLSKGQLYNWWKLGEWNFDVWPNELGQFPLLPNFRPSHQATDVSINLRQLPWCLTPYYMAEDRGTNQNR